MKKNLMMRAASVLLVAVMLTTCAISGTFAKYVTAETGSDSARVAKFGVQITANGSTFAETYNTDDTSAGIGAVSVSSDGTGAHTKLVAPGTKKDMASMVLSGTPEVAVKVSYEATVVDLGDNWIDKDDNSKFYCPLKVVIRKDDSTTTLCGLDYATAGEFEQAIKDNIKSYSRVYDPKTNLGEATVVDDSLKVSWVWPFEADGTYAVNQQTNEKDTYLGDCAAGIITGKAAAYIDLTIKTTVEQID